MTQPVAYSRLFNFNTYQLTNPAAPYVGSQHDGEFNAVAATLSAILVNLALIQRDDGALANASVTPDSLNQATINMIGQWAPKGTWTTATNYSVRDMVTPSGGTLSYVCAVANTSGATFAGDLALGYWQPINGAGVGAITAATITFSATDKLLGRATAGAGTGEEIICTAAARSILDDASVAAICTTLGVGAASNPTFGNVTASNLTASALTANSFLFSGTAGLLTTTAAPTNGQLLIGSTGVSPVAASLTGTANQVIVTPGAGSVTLSLPQNIHTAALPTFAGLTTTGNVGIGTSISTVNALSVSSASLTSVNQIGVNSDMTGTSAATAIGTAFNGIVRTAAAAFTMTTAATFLASAAAKGAGSTITSDIGFLALDRTFGAINVGFQSNLAAAASAFAFLGAGTAQSQFGGNVMVGGAMANGQLSNVKSNMSSGALAGATTTFAANIPAGSLVLGISVRVLTLITGCASFQVGDGTGANRYGNAIALAAGTTTSIADFTLASPLFYPAATGVVLTAVGGGGTFTGGTIRVTCHYISLTPATS